MERRAVGEKTSWPNRSGACADTPRLVKRVDDSNGGLMQGPDSLASCPNTVQVAQRG